MKKNKKINESSVTADIKGYIGNPVAVTDPYAAKSLKKTKKTEKPWYLKSMNEVKDLVIENLVDRKLFLEEKQKPLTADEYIENLKKLLSQQKEKLIFSPKDYGIERNIKRLKAQIVRAEKAIKQGGEDWRDYLAAGKLAPNLKKSQKDKEEIAVPKEIDSGTMKKLDFLISWTNLKSVGTPWGKKSIRKILKKYKGEIPSTKKEYEKITNWVEGTLLPNYVDFYKFRDFLATYTKPKKGKSVPKDIPASMMSVKPKGKRTAPSPNEAYAEIEMPDTPGVKKLSALYNKLSKTAEHGIIPFAKPGEGRLGPGHILNKIYKQVGNSVLKNHLDKKYPKVDLIDVLDRYGNLPDNQLDNLKLHFSQDELRALADYDEMQKKVENLSVESDRFIPFEKIWGQVARNVLGAEEKKEEFQASGFSTKSMKTILSKLTGVSLDDVENKLVDLKNESPNLYDDIVNKAFNFLKKSDPNAYEIEMKQKFKREKASRPPEVSHKDLDKTIAHIDDPGERDNVLRKFEKAADRSAAFKKVIHNKPDDEKQFKKTMGALSRASEFMKEPTGEPRDLSPEEMKSRQEMGAFAHQQALEKKAREMQKQKIKDLIRQREEKMNKMKKATNEVFSLVEFLLKKNKEGKVTDSSGELCDAEASEEPWEKAKLAKEKDFVKDLSLESIYEKQKEKK